MNIVITMMHFMKRIKGLTEGGHHVHIGKIKAHMGVEENIEADLAAKKVVTQKNIDPGWIAMICLSQT